MIPFARQSFLTRNALAFGLLFLAVGIFAITGRSLWIDEALTAHLARQPSLAACWSEMRTVPEIQLPLYMLYTWTYGYLFGTGEWTLRVAGLPWFLFGATVFAINLGRSLRSRAIPALLISLSAFVWYYLNEARNYSMQLGLVLAVLGAAMAVMQTLAAGNPSQRHWRLFFVCFVLLCATSVLAAMWAFFFFLGFVILVPRQRWIELVRLSPFILAACAIGLCIVAGYYGWTMTLNAKPTMVGTTTPQTIVFVFYELLGATGLGPGRYDLRSAGARALGPYIGILSVFAITTALIFWQGLIELRSRFGAKRVVLAGAFTFAPLILLCAIGVSTHFRVLGRHATPLLPVLWLALAFGVARLWTSQRWPRRAFVLAFFGLSFVSCLNVRFGVRHEKDDYRSAAALGRRAAAEGQTVWWNADMGGATYYGLSNNTPTRSSVVFLANPNVEDLQTVPKPDVVIMSKPDTYDARDALGKYLRERSYRVSTNFPAFVVWRKEG